MGTISVKVCYRLVNSCVFSLIIAALWLLLLFKFVFTWYVIRLPPDSD